MRVCNVFEREEIDSIRPDFNFLEYISDHNWSFCNDVVVSWYIESPYEDDPDYEEFDEDTNAINKFLISKGCSIDELVYIDVTW